MHFIIHDLKTRQVRLSNEQFKAKLESDIRTTKIFRLSNGPKLDGLKMNKYVSDLLLFLHKVCEKMLDEANFNINPKLI